MTLLERLALRLSVGKRRGRVASAKAAIEALLDEEVPGRMARDRVPGLVVMVRFADGTEIQKAIGSAGSNGPIRLDSRFPGGSVYKSIAALCALSLVESGMLSLDEPFWKRARSWQLPPSRYGAHSIEGVTLRRLLSHSAGFDEVLYGRGPIGPLPCARDLLALAESDGRHMHLACAPGTEFRYSSAGYLLVQLLIEEAAQAPLGDVVRERVLLPLGMRASVYGPTPEVAEHIVTGHDAQGRALPPTYSLAAVEGLFTTAGDLATFAAALLPGPQGEPAGRGVVTPTMCREMLTSQVAHPNGDGWGLGFRVKKEAADVRFEQVGRDAGTIGQFLGFVRRRITAAIYCNTDAGNDLVRGLARDIRHLLHRIPV